MIFHWLDFSQVCRKHFQKLFENEFFKKLFENKFCFSSFRCRIRQSLFNVLITVKILLKQLFYKRFSTSDRQSGSPCHVHVIFQKLFEVISMFLKAF